MLFLLPAGETFTVSLAVREIWYDNYYGIIAFDIGRYATCWRSGTSFTC